MKVLYLMHVNWHWIRQRPQVLAEQLAKVHEVRVMHYAMFRGGHHAGGVEPPAGSRALRRLPGRLKRSMPLLARWDSAWIARQVAAEVGRDIPDLIWLTHPDFANAALASGVSRIVYDCMDDYLAFHTHDVSTMCRAEIQLLEMAELTVFSSATLAERVSCRAQPRRQLVVNNGVDESLVLRAALKQRPPTSTTYTLGYFGTLSHWFDWPLVLQILQTFPAVRLCLAGPVETTLPAHPRIQYMGVLPHHRLAAFSAACDALVMPFRLTPLIKAVDPVKLYEYVAFNRPALAPRYRESERFEPHVTLYGDAEEALSTLKAWTMTAPALADAREFLQSNTWQQRGTQILASLT